MQVQVVRGCPIRNGLIDFFPPAIVNPQIAQLMVSGSSPLLSGLFVTFLFSNRGLREILSLSDVK